MIFIAYLAIIKVTFIAKCVLNITSMARIVIKNLSEKSLEVTDLTKSLLQHFHDHHLDWMHACGGKGRCTTCKAIVVEGEENFGPLTPPELKYYENKGLRDHERLSCQSRISGDVCIRVPGEYKLPHMKYSD
jgi:2Fe-2S ferredoxin